MPELTLEELKLLISQLKELDQRASDATRHVVNTPEYEKAITGDKDSNSIAESHAAYERFTALSNKMHAEAFVRTFDEFVQEKGESLSPIIKQEYERLQFVNRGDVNYDRDGEIIKDVQFATIYNGEYEKQYYEKESVQFKETFAAADLATRMQMITERTGSDEFKHLAEKMAHSETWMDFTISNPEYTNNSPLENRINTMKVAVKDFQLDAGMGIKEMDSQITANEFNRLQELAKSLGLTILGKDKTGKDFDGIDEDNIKISENGKSAGEAKAEFKKGAIKR